MTYATTFGLIILAQVPISNFGASKNPLLQDDFPFQGACISAKFPEKNVALKGLAIRVGEDASMLWDADLLRFSGGWTGGFITTHGVAFDGGHGGHPTIEGDQKFGTLNLPGWSVSNEFVDPRTEPFGPIPTELGQWKGVYVAGDKVGLHYTFGGADILEQPGSVTLDGETAFTRSFSIQSVPRELNLYICEVENGGSAKVESKSVTINGKNKSRAIASLEKEGDITSVGATSLPNGASFSIANSKMILRLPKSSEPAKFKLVIWKGEKAKEAKFPALLEQEASFADFKKGGETRWPEEVVTRGALNTSKTPDGAYVTDSLTPPFENPWKRRVRFGGLDFFKDGKRAALCTWDGDIWIVSGIDDKLENLKWRRFASGMYETLGLKIVDDIIYTSGRDQLTRYHDFNKDGEADYYECFNNQYTSSEGFHEFVFDLQTDSAGNFYFSKAGPVRPGGSNFETVSANAGTLMKVSRDGSNLEVVATGFRAPNGIGVGPDGQLTTGDNEGTWIPACPINWVKPGGFYGVEQLAHRDPVPDFNPPLCWLSKNGWDNSGGGQVWVTSDQWGGLKGELLHCSYGESSLYLVMKQELSNGQMQGGVVRIPVKFTSSAMRPKFNPADGQLYVAGLQGWQTKAVRASGLDRVRYTGKPLYTARDLKVDKQGVHITFSQPLDETLATDTQNYAVERWNYRRTSGYGSPEFSAANPDQQAHDKVEVIKASLSSDKKTVTLQVADLAPVMQMKISYSIESSDATPIDQSILHTIHAVE